MAHRNRKRHGEPKKVFGVKIDSRSSDVPEHLELWLNILETDLTVEGLFRVNGATTKINKLRTAIEEGEEVDYRQYTPHDIAGLVKMYFRDLPGPLIPLDLYDCFIAAALTPRENEVPKVHKVVKLLPPGHKCMLFRLSKFFTAVAAHSAENKMSIDNLATVVAPSLFRHPLEATNMQLVVADFPLQIKLVHTIISNHSSIFKGYTPHASEETLERVQNFKKIIEEQYAFGTGSKTNTFTNKMKNRYATYRVVALRQSASTDRVVSEKYERIKSGAITYEETRKMLEVLLIHWQASNNVTGPPKKSKTPSYIIIIVLIM